MRALAKDERGSGAVLVLVGVALSSLALLVGLAAVAVTVARHRAESAADLAALAAAGAVGMEPAESICSIARRVAEANAAVLATCRVVDGEVLVVVAADRLALPRLLRRWTPVVRATARAGREPAPRAGRWAGTSANRGTS